MSSPRLRQIVATEAASEICDLVRRHITRMNQIAGLRARGEGSKQFPDDVLRIVEWVKRGPGRHEEGFLKLLFAIYGTAHDVVREIRPVVQHDTTIGVVVAAGLARARIMTGKSVPSSQLACLGSVDTSRIRQLVRNATLRRVAERTPGVREMDAPICYEDALRWLRQRAVQGLDDASQTSKPTRSHLLSDEL